MKFLRQFFGIAFLTLLLNLPSRAVDIFVNPLFLNFPNITINTFGSLKEAFQNIEIYYLNDEIFKIFLSGNCAEDVDFSYVLSKNFTITSQSQNFTAIVTQNASISLTITGSLRMENISFDGMNSKKTLTMIVTQNASIFLKNWEFKNYEIDFGSSSLIQASEAQIFKMENVNFSNITLNNSNFLTNISSFISLANLNQEVSITNLSLNNFTQKNQGFIKAMNCSLITLNKIIINSSRFNFAAGDKIFGILFDLIDSENLTLNSWKITNFCSFSGPSVMRVSKSILGTNKISINLNNTIFMNSNMILPFIYIEDIYSFSVTNSFFYSLQTYSLLYLTSLVTFTIENTTFSQLNLNNANRATIINILNTQTIFVNNISCIDSSSFNSTTCISLVNTGTFVSLFSLKNSFFYRNVASYLQSSSSSQGVCLYFSISYSGSISIQNSTFQNNQLKGLSSSPCIYSNSLQDSMIISNSKFIENSADYLETCLIHQGSLISIQDSEFSENFNSVLDPSSNAAATLASFYMSLSRVIFSKNQAVNGAAILIINSQNKPSTIAFFDNLILDSNTAIYSPMLFSSNIQAFDISIFNSTFHSNVGLIKGGVFQTWYALYGNTLQFVNCIFSNNTAIAAGGIAYIANLGNELDFINCSFIDNRALHDGGGAINMYGDPNTVVQSRNCQFIRNTAKNKGGVFLITTGSYYDNGSIFLENHASQGGVIAINFFSILNLENSQIRNCSATSAAGVMKMMGQADVTLGNISVASCGAPKGGVFVTGGLTVLRITDCMFSENQAINATLMYATNTAYEISIKNSIFQKNKGSRNGFELSSCEISLENTQFVDNEVNLFFMQLSTVNMKAIQIKNQYCIQGQSGCLMNIQSKSEVNISDFLILDVNSEESQGNFLVVISTLRIENGEINRISIMNKGDLVSSDQSLIEFRNISLQNFKTVSIWLVKSEFLLNSSMISQSNISIDSGFGAISCTNCLGIKILNTHFENISNFNQYSGVITIQGSFSSNRNVFSILNCSFINNLGILGGGISINNANLSISQTLFANNFAKFGAGVYLYCDISIYCFWELTLNNFTSNNASVSGGGIRWEPYEPKMNNSNIFLNNSAFFGKDIASQPIRLSVTSLSDLDQFNGFASGNTLNSFSLNLLDYYDQVVKGLEGFALIKVEYLNATLYAKTILGLLGSQVVSFLNNTFTFSDLTIIGTPLASLYLSITSGLIPFYYAGLLNQKKSEDQGQYYREKQNQENLGYELQIFVSLRLCELGEIYNPVENTCILCPYGQYSLIPNSTACQECPKNIICNGGYNLSLEKGFWRANNLSTDIYPCLISGVCLGGFESNCREGYSGPLCDVCVVDSTIQYYKFGGTSCDSCKNENPLGFVMFVLFYLMMVLYVVFTIKKNIDSVNTIETLNYEIPVFLKIGMDYVQIISTISLLNVRWPSNFTVVLNTSGSAGNLNSIMFPFECILAKLSMGTDIFYLKMFLGSIFAWFNFIFSGLVWIVYMKIKGKTMEVFKKEIIITIVVVGFTLQPSIVNMYFTAINCIEIEGQFFVKKQLTLKCWEGEHLRIFSYFVMPSLLLWSIILPVLCFFYVKNNIKSKNYQTRASLIYITKGVRPQFFYWEFVMMAKRYCVSMISAFMISDLTLATSLILLVITFFAILNLTLKPYNLMVFNTLQEYSFYSSFLVFIFCLYYVVDLEEKSQLICVIFVILGLVIFLSRFLKNIINAYTAKLKVIVSKMETLVGSKKKISNSLRPGQSQSNDMIASNGTNGRQVINSNKSQETIKNSSSPMKINKLPLKTMKITPAPNKYLAGLNQKKTKKGVNLKTQEINLKLHIRNEFE